MARVALALAAVITAALPAGSALAGPPVVAIRARAALEITRVRQLGDGQVEVHGALRDPATGQGLGGETVALQIGGAEAGAVTGADGTFAAVLPAPPGPVDVHATFAGARSIDTAAVVAAQIDPSLAPVELAVVATAAPGGLELIVTARSDDGPLALPLALRIAPTDADEPHRDLAVVAGRPTTIGRADALGAGPRRFTVRFAGDATHAPATASAVVQLTSATHITVTAPRQVAFDETVVVRGTVTDEDGAALPQVTVTLTDEAKRRLASATTDARGRFRVAAEASLLGAGPHAVVIAAEPRESWLGPSQSPPSTITVGAPQPAPVAITIAAFAATALTALGFILARRRRERRPAPVAADDAAIAPDPKGGVELPRPSLVSTLRRASDHGFAGHVRDASRNRPLTGAVIVLSQGEDERRAEADGAGRFAFEALPAGEWAAVVAAAGHVPEQLSVSIPHRGELRGVRIDLVPVRERVFAIYRKAAQPLLPRPELWGIWSPRQIVDHVRAARPPTALAALTALVEEVYFSGRTFEPAVIPTVQQQAAAAIAERSAGVAV
ncbi:MAG: carboxypeptidase-like regulatory domain-containing protein [Kofleriaceae bacterium]